MDISFDGLGTHMGYLSRLSNVAPTGICHHPKEKAKSVVNQRERFWKAKAALSLRHIMDTTLHACCAFY